MLHLASKSPIKIKGVYSALDNGTTVVPYEVVGTVEQPVGTHQIREACYDRLRHVHVNPALALESGILLDPPREVTLDF